MRPPPAIRVLLVAVVAVVMLDLLLEEIDALRVGLTGSRLVDPSDRVSLSVLRPLVVSAAAAGPVVAAGVVVVVVVGFRKERVR